MVTKVIRTTHGLDMATVLGLPLNVKVLVWREKPKKWTSPWLMVIQDRYIYKINFNRKIINICITSVKPYKEINKKKELLVSGQRHGRAMPCPVTMYACRV